MISYRFFLCLVFMWGIPITIFCQRNPAIYTPSPYTLQTELLTPSLLFISKTKLPVYRIEIIDNRFDFSKLGYKPVYKNAPKEIKLQGSLPDLIKTIFADGVETDNSQERKLIIVIQHCWITYFSNNKFSFLKKNLIAALEYKFEYFTAKDTSYYPVKRMNGKIELLYNEEITNKVLVDSMTHLLLLEIAKLKIDEKENPGSLITETRMENYITQKKANLPKRINYGVFASFDDFMNQKVITDSIDIIPYKDYYDRNIVAANLGIIKNGMLEPGNKYWGFFDGRYLFYNTGNGFFIRLIPVNNQFVFADLQQIVLNSKKKSITSEARIGQSSYDIIKDFGKAYHLFFQLNFEDGKLY